MRMTPEQYFAVRGESYPSLFYEAPRMVRPLHRIGHILGSAPVDTSIQVPEIPNTNNHTALIIGAVAIVAIIGIVALGLVFFSRKD